MRSDEHFWLSFKPSPSFWRRVFERLGLMAPVKPRTFVITHILENESFTLSPSNE